MMRIVYGVAATATLALTGCTARAERREGPPSVVLVSLDTLRADHVGVYGYADALTPNLDAFAKEAVVFERAFSQASQTAPSHASVFTGVYPSELAGSDTDATIITDHPMLAQVLQIYGFQTGAAVAGGHLSPQRGLNLGFDSYRPSRDFGSLYHTRPMAISWLDKRDPQRPFFLFVHGYDAHPRYLKPTPYGYIHADVEYRGRGREAVFTASQRIVDHTLFPEFGVLMTEYQTALRPRSPAGRELLQKKAFHDQKPLTVSAADLQYVSQIYDGAVSYVDAMLGELMADLQDRGVLDEAYVIIMSDHGEQLGEDGVFWHGLGLDDEETHVVLMVRQPGGVGGGRRIAGMAELVDILPTVTELTGATAPAGIDGRSFASALRGEPWEGRAYVHAQSTRTSRMVSVRGESGRLTYTGLVPSSPLLADVIEVAQMNGPGLIASDGLSPPEQEALRTEMLRWIRDLQPPMAVEVPALSADLKKSLRAAGYWDASP